MSNLKMNCGYCGRKCSLEKDFCIPQDSVYVCKSCYEWQGKVADLEAKLAETEEKIKELEEKSVFEKSNAFELGERAIMSTLKENKQLKQQLAEKEKQIETQKSNIEFLYDLFVSPKGEQTLKAINQDKISFAVEQLEKVKDHNENIFCDDKVYYTYITQFIDQQIKQLKEMK